MNGLAGTRPYTLGRGALRNQHTKAATDPSTNQGLIPHTSAVLGQSIKNNSGCIRIDAAAAHEVLPGTTTYYDVTDAAPVLLVR
jgi:hypothetical protein